MGLVKGAALGVLGLAVLTAGALLVIDLPNHPWDAPIGPVLARAVLARAQHHHAQVQRDTYGVPHISGKTDADTAFGLAYAQSEDDFSTIQQVTFAVRGTLAGIEGMHAAKTDYLVGLFRIWETLDQHYQSDLPDDLRAVLEAYADGVNQYAATHQTEVSPGLLPVTGRDIAAGFMFRTPFFYQLDQTLLAISTGDPAAHLGKTAKTAFRVTDQAVEIGSNAVAVGPARSNDGATRLLVNSHQPYSGPVAWYEAVLQSEEGWHVAGGFFPGTPFMLHGFNAHLGWANTVNLPKLADVYALRINPANAHQYWLDGGWHDFEVKSAALRIKLLGPLYITLHRELLWSAQGPVLTTDHGSFALRYAGMGEWRQALQYYRLNKARNLAEWTAAMAIQALPSINYIYADEQKNIGYVYNGQFPNRLAGLQWDRVLPGDNSAYIWHGYLPYSSVPQLWNPKSGLLFNSNNTPFRATDPADDMHPEYFPEQMGIQNNMTNRAYRALETYGAQSQISADDFRRNKFDLSYSRQSTFSEAIDGLCALDAKGDADILAAQTILRNWDRRTNRENRATAMAVLSRLPFLRSELLHVPLTDTPLSALRQAISVLKTHYGRLDPQWGEVNRIKRGDHDLPIDGGPDIYRAVYGDLGDDGRLYGIAGDTLIMFVTWDKDGHVSAEDISQYGSAASRPESPHYADQMAMFASMHTKPVWFSSDQLQGHVERAYGVP